MQATTDRMRADIEAMCLEKGRMVGSPGHAQVQAWLLDQMRALDLVPYADDYRLPYAVGYMAGFNLVGVFRGRDRALPPILLGAHYDSVIAAPCADDNAAAVAILLEIARGLSHEAFERDVVFAFFDAEEPPWFQTPAMGSTRFVEDVLDDRGVHCALILDLMGHDVPIALGDDDAPEATGLRDLFFVTGCESREALAGLVGANPLPSRLRLIATRNENVGDMSDHHAFRLAGQPYLFFSCGRWEHYHMPTDTPERLNFEKMARMTSWIAALLPALDRTALPATGVAPYEVDTVAFEAATLRASLGPVLPLLQQAAGIETLETRQGLDRLAETMLGLGL